MMKRAILLAIIVLLVIPMLVPDFTLEGFFDKGQEVVEDAYEVFFRQDPQGNNVLLADKGGHAFLVCFVEGENTHLISILPTACPKGEQSGTFLSIYQQKGINALKEKVSQSLSCNITGYLEVDYSGIAPVVDALGGVQMDGKTYTGAELEIILENLPQDSAGTKVGQDVVLAIGRRFCSAGFWKGQNALGKLLRITDTDLSIATLVKIGKDLIPALEGKGLHRYCLPNEDSWIWMKNGVLR